MKGVLAPGLVPGLLREVYAGRRTGSLRFARGERLCGLRFVNGHVVRAEATPPELHMGEIMVARGLLTQESLVEATRIVRGEGKRLGVVLLELGVIDQAQLENSLALHVCEVLADVLRWSQGSYAFDDEDGATLLEDPDYPLKMSTGDMILEAVTLVADREAVRFGTGDLDRVLLPSTSALLRFQHISLAPIDGFVLSRIDGTLNAREVIQVTPLPAEAVERSLFALLCVGLVEPAPREARGSERASAQFLRQEILDTYAALAARNHFEVLGLPPSASDAEIRAAFFRLAKRWHPDVHRDPALADLRDRLAGIFRRLTEAHEVLSNPRACAEYRARLEPAPSLAGPAPPPPVEPANPEDLYLRAKQRFDDGRYWEAVALLVETVAVARGALRTRARVLLARAYLKHPESVKAAEKELLAAIQESPDDVEAYYLLGNLYKQAGLGARARAMFRRVLELDPRNRQAKAELEALAKQGS